MHDTQPRWDPGDWPTQHLEPVTGLRAWFCEPRFVVVHAPGPRFDEALARAMVATIDGVIARRQGALRPGGGVVLVHDLRRCSEVTRAAEQVVQAAWRTIDPRDVAESWVLTSHLDRLTRTVVNLINAVAFVATGKRQHLVHDPAALLARHRLTPPPQGTPFP